MSSPTIELQRQVSELLVAVGRAEGKIDMFLRELVSHDRRLTDSDDRVRKVESGQHRAAGASAAVGTLIGAIASFVMAHFATK